MRPATLKPATLRIAGCLAVVLALTVGTSSTATGEGRGSRSTVPMTPSETTTYAIPGDVVFPEGVAADPRTGLFYVSSTTDGTIYRGHVRRPALEVFLPGGADGRTTAIGLRLDTRGRLFIAGGATGQMWVYDTRTRSLIRRFDTGLREGTFINDAAVDRAGNAYFTDSLTPVLWRVPRSALRKGADEQAAGTPQRFLEFAGTPVEYVEGFNLNGIAATAGGRQLLTVQSNTGKLFRIDLATRTAAEVSVDGGPVTAGDGLVSLGSRLLVVRNSFELIVTLTVRGTAARVVNTYTDPTFGFPTTAAAVGHRLLVVNSQFDRRSAGEPPELPFTVSGVPLRQVLSPAS